MAQPQPGYVAQPGVQIGAGWAAQPAMQMAGQPGMQMAGQPWMQVAGQPGMQMAGQPGMQMAGQTGQEQPHYQWITRPEAIPGIPPGLEYFATLDTVLVSQLINMVEVMSRGLIHRPNEYVILNKDGMKIFDAKEEVAEWMLVYGNRRGFQLHVYDNTGYEVMRIHKDMSAMCAGCHCCAEKESCKVDINIEAPPGQLIGKAKQMKSCCEAKFNVEDANENVILTIQGGGGCQCVGADTSFQVMSADGSTNVGNIIRKWSGLQSYVSMADNFSISFPMDMDVKAKACMLGALILIDFRYFEVSRQRT